MKNLYILEPEDTENTVGNRESTFLKRISISCNDYLFKVRVRGDERGLQGKEFREAGFCMIWGEKMVTFLSTPNRQGSEKDPKMDSSSHPEKKEEMTLLLGFSCLSRSESYFQPFSS